jgi:hypothetical protein
MRAGGSIAVCLGGLLLLACNGDPAESAPTEVPATTDPRPVGDPTFIADAEAAMRANPIVISALGTNFDVVITVPFTDPDNHPIKGVVFTVKLPEPVALPAGLPTWEAHGEGYTGPLEKTFTDEPSSPTNYANVWIGNDFTMPYLLPLADYFGERYEAEAQA